ncbi:MAG: alcohol dehydrogenase [Chloroflexi bacterium]|jgi:NADPH2:quinone reductase|nr:alcohol dehydrogenase [Chloroflexota bacterium]MBL16892.1 alcohol dehydrogenase [Chloroflexota bacterium]MDP6498867.1 NADPH:quinone reductase [Dehalococcoidia bacterium]MQG56167.1 NADPH:quinone reductase [SAR202 cluster bacterium]|tara:strand:- start:19686 stop:20660 length:975 start_codon:yes stop_codon:yes gene_type:complete
MKAVWYEQNGGAEILQYGDMPDPEPGPGEVRVKVATSGVNPSDWKRRQGLTASIGFPRVIPNQDGAGMIDAVGDGVDSSRIGERVWLFESQFGRAFGTAAEYTAQPSGHAIHLPDNTDFAAAAGLGVPAMTAHRCVFSDGPVTGKTVLVTGGAGAVGRYAIQLAKLGGAAIISTVSSDEKAQIARDAGADHTINYREENVTERIIELSNSAGVDLVVEVDMAANFPVSQQVLKRSGVLAVYSGGSSQAPAVPLSFKSTNVTVRMVLVYDMPEVAKAAAVADITSWLEQGKLTPFAGPHFSLEGLKDAHLAVEHGAIGKVVVDVS